MRNSRVLRDRLTLISYVAAAFLAPAAVADPLTALQNTYGVFARIVRVDAP